MLSRPDIPFSSGLVSLVVLFVCSSPAVKTADVGHREPAENLDNLSTAEAAFFQACMGENLDSRSKVSKPVLLQEATRSGEWSQDGVLLVDGYSKRIMKLLGLEK